MFTFIFWLAAWVALCWLVAKFVAINHDEGSDDERIDSIRAELDVQEMKTKRVRGLS